MNKQEYVNKSLDICNEITENLTIQLNETHSFLQDILKRLGVEDDDVFNRNFSKTSKE